MTRTMAVAGRVREALRQFHLRHIPHRLTVVVALNPADLNAVLARPHEVEEPVYMVDGVAWVGHHQVVPMASVPQGQVRLLVDAEGV